MRKVDYAYIVLLTVITILLLLLVLKPDPKPPQPKQYSEVVCEHLITDAFKLGDLSPMARKSRRLKALKAFAKPIEARLKDGWVMIMEPPPQTSIVCFAR